MKSKNLLSTIFRKIIKPIANRLPDYRYNQILTIAHNIKLTLFHGQVLEFRKVEKAICTQNELKIQDWVITELKEISEIEHDLYPTQTFLSGFHTYQPIVPKAACSAYDECSSQITEKADIIFITPWMKHGGADLGTIHHINYCQTKGLKVLLITTLNEESPLLQQLSLETHVLEFGKITKNLTTSDRMTILIRIILQLNTKRIHIINSQLGWELIKSYGKNLKSEEILVYVSLYASEKSNNIIMGYETYIPSTLTCITGIICDTEIYPKILNCRYGIPKNKLHTIYFPSPYTHTLQYTAKPNASILWASRICAQKRPDLLLEIAKKMPDINFIVKGEADSSETAFIKSQLQKLKNVTTTGIYNAKHLVDSQNDYSLFLYTSLDDGLPNVLLEVTKFGLPIVASNIGGVSEFINSSTGYLINKDASADDYISLIRKIINDQEGNKKRWENAANLLNKRHSLVSFAQMMDNIKDYTFSLRSEE